MELNLVIGLSLLVGLLILLAKWEVARIIVRESLLHPLTTTVILTGETETTFAKAVRVLKERSSQARTVDIAKGVEEDSRKRTVAVK